MKPRTSLSAGEVIRSVLLLDEGVAAITGKVYPVATDKADLPYITYRRASLEPRPTKGRPSNDTIEMEVNCFAAGYGAGVELAEAVRAALEGTDTTVGGLRMRSCLLTGAEEDWADDAYLQTLTFEVRISPVSPPAP